jgi:hypothetical protein
MVYNTQKYWVSGLCASSGILNRRKYNVLETGGQKQIQFPKCCFLAFRILDNGQSPETQYF